MTPPALKAALLALTTGSIGFVAGLMLGQSGPGAGYPLRSAFTPGVSGDTSAATAEGFLIAENPLAPTKRIEAVTLTCRRDLAKPVCRIALSKLENATLAAPASDDLEVINWTPAAVTAQRTLPCRTEYWVLDFAGKRASMDSVPRRDVRCEPADTETRKFRLDTWPQALAAAASKS